MRCEKCKSEIETGKECYYEGKVICQRCWVSTKKPAHLYSWEKHRFREGFK